MSYLEWSDSFSVQVEEIDRQHKRLVEILNSLHAAHVAQKGRAVQEEIVSAMVSYAKDHFDTEERYMQKTGFPGYRLHKTEHDQFTTKALDLKKRIEAVGFVFTLEIIEFLKDWLQTHILGTDLQYADHFKKHGLS